MAQFKHTEIATLEEAFNTGNGAGYVLNFSDKTFALYFDEEFSIDIDDPKYHDGGTSKGKRLRTFLAKTDSATAAFVLVSLWDHRAAILEHQGREGGGRPGGSLFPHRAPAARRYKSGQYGCTP